MRKKEKFINKWEKIRDKGKLTYSIKGAMLIFIFADLGNFSMRLILDNWYRNNRHFLIDQIVAFIFLFTFSVFLCFSIYHKNERKYNQLMNENV